MRPQFRGSGRVLEPDTGFGLQFGQVVQAALAAQVVGVVDDGLCDTRSHVVSELAEEVRQMSRA
jgi:hypothetical protein